MAADISALKRIYRRYARINAVSPGGLAEQIAWLTTTFIRQASSTDGDSAQATSITDTGGSSSWQFPASNAEEKAAALDELLTDLELELAGEFNASKPTVLTPNFSQLRR